jgi:hypothetical protein
LVSAVAVPFENPERLTPSAAAVQGWAAGGATMPESSGLTLDHRMLAALAQQVEAGDPIAWRGTELDRETVYDLIASQIAEMFRGYETSGVPRDRQMVIALAAVVKLTVENFVLHQRLLRGAPPGPRNRGAS